MTALANPFSQLLTRAPARLPKAVSSSLVIDGQRITSARQLTAANDDAERIAQAKKELARVRSAERYQRNKNDPADIARRATWYAANREKVLAYKRDYNARNIERQRELNRDWMRRQYAADSTKYVAASRRYYERHREEILAKKAEQYAAAKAAKTRAAG